MDHKPIDMFRKTVSFLFREIGIIESFNHAQVYRKRSNKHGFFDDCRRKSLARKLYHETKHEDSPVALLKKYEELTGLTLSDIHLAFEEGDWDGGFGGPKWADIAEETIGLGEAIIEGDQEAMDEHTRHLESMKHNNGRLVDKFNEL